MTELDIDQTVIVSKDSLQSNDPYDVIWSNIQFVNALLEEHLTTEELSRDAMRSYYVDYYLAQVNNGGFSQFVYNSGWNEFTVRCIREGLKAMGARAHLELFRQSASIIDRIGPEGMEQFFESEYFGDNKERDTLSEFDEKFFDLAEDEDLVQLNSDWLKSIPGLAIMTSEEIEAEVQRRAMALPDREARIAKSLENEPIYMKLIRALCGVAGHELDRVTAGDPSFRFEGHETTSWHFLTDKGHFYMADINHKALMFTGDTDELVCEIDMQDGKLL